MNVGQEAVLYYIFGKWPINKSKKNMHGLQLSDFDILMIYLG